jgi:hypothetical protein
MAIINFIVQAQGANVIKTFIAIVRNFRNKLECLLLASLSSLVNCLWARPGAYLRVEHLKDVSLG